MNQVRALVAKAQYMLSSQNRVMKELLTLKSYAFADFSNSPACVHAGSTKGVSSKMTKVKIAKDIHLQI